VRARADTILVSRSCLRADQSTSSYAVNATVIANADISNASPSSGGSSPPIGAIAGGVAGGLVAFLVIGGLLWWRKRKARREHAGGTGSNTYWADDDMAGAGSGPVMAHTYRCVLPAWPSWAR
jgi:hypothetical protein